MKKWSLLFILLLCFSFHTDAEAHSGRTDGNGGHNCSEKSIAKGLCTGYHYHNGGGGSAPATSPAPAAVPKEKKPVYNPKVHYDKGYAAGVAQGQTIGYEKGDEDIEPTDSNEDFNEGWSAGFKVGYAEGLKKIKAKEQEEKDKKEAAAQGLKDGRSAFAEGKDKEEYAFETQVSETYKIAYKETFTIAWEEAKDEESCFEEGYQQGLVQDELTGPANCEKETLRKEFEKGHDKGVKERDDIEIDKLTKQGEELGYEVAELVVPSEITKTSYKTAFEEGYDHGMNKRKDQVLTEGYNFAFKQLDFVNEVYTENEILGIWYKEGYESNNVAEEIKSTAQTLGEESEEYVIAEEFKVNDDSVSLYDSLFAKGQGIKEQREKEQRNLMLSVLAIGAPAAGGFYYWRKKSKNVKVKSKISLKK